MVASKGGISRKEAGAMTRSQARDMCIALAIVQGNDVDWKTGAIKPPKELQK